MLSPDQRARLNNLATEAQRTVAWAVGAEESVLRFTNTYEAFKQTGLDVEAIEDDDFEGRNGYITAEAWADFTYALSVLEVSMSSVKNALYGILDTVPNSGMPF